MTEPLPGQLGFDLDQAEDAKVIAEKSGFSAMEVERPLPGNGNGACETAGAWWLAFSADHDPEDARRIFRTRTGQDPQEVRPGLKGLLVAGPVATPPGAGQDVAG
jgi:hypothetical protein